jgi:hypothetical protein
VSETVAEQRVGEDGSNTKSIAPSARLRDYADDSDSFVCTASATI